MNKNENIKREIVERGQIKEKDKEIRRKKGMHKRMRKWRQNARMKNSRKKRWNKKSEKERKSGSN